jgi:hypothetical protein
VIASAEGFWSAAACCRFGLSRTFRINTITIAGCELRLAALRDIIASKRAAGRPRDRAVLENLARTL